MPSSVLNDRAFIDVSYSAPCTAVLAESLWVSRLYREARPLVVIEPRKAVHGLGKSRQALSYRAQSAEKRRFGFPNCMRFREQIGAQFFGWNVCLEAIGELPC